MSEKALEFLGSNRFISPIIIVISCIIIYNVISLILSKAVIKGKTEVEAKRRRTLILLVNNIIKYIVLIVGAILILKVYDVDTTSLVAGLGIASVVIGLAIQDALKDIIGGINIILENYYILGDTVKYNDFTGNVIELGLKSTKIKAESGEVLVLANRSVDKVVNLSQKQAVLNIEVPTSQTCEIKKVRKVLETIVEKIQKLDHVEAKGCEYIGIVKLDSSIVTYAFKIKCKQGSQAETKRMALELIKEAYDQEGLKFS